MNKATLDQMWDQFRQKYGVYLRLLESFPDDSLATLPVPGMRSPAELAVHVSSTCVRDIAEGVARGQITADEAAEAKIAADMVNSQALVAFARECFERADAAVKRIGDAELAAMVPTPWKSVWPGWVAFHVSERRVHAPPRAALRLRARVRRGAALPVELCRQRARVPTAGGGPAGA